MYELDQNIKNERKTQLDYFNKNESDRMINDVKLWIDRLQNMKNMADLQSTYSNVDEAKHLRLYINNVNQWKTNGVTLKSNAHPLFRHKLEERINDNFNIRSSLYNERLKML